MYRRADTSCACPPCLPKSAAGGGSQWREAFILTIDGWRLPRYCLCQSASHRTISVAAAEITLSTASVPVVLTCSPIAAIMKTQFQTQYTMQTPQALLDSVSAFHFKKGAAVLGKEKKRSDVNIQRSEKQWHGDPGLRH